MKHFYVIGDFVNIMLLLGLKDIKLFGVKAPISLAWRLVGDLLATRVSVGRGDVAATSPGDLAGREGVAVKSNMFDFFCDSLETFSSLQLVSETSRRRRSD